MQFENYYYFRNPQQLISEAQHRIGFNSKNGLKLWRFYKELVGTKVSLFDYDNLPSGIESDLLEIGLVYMNRLCFYKPKGLDKVYLCTYTNADDETVVSSLLYPTKVYVQTLNGKLLTDEAIDFEDIVVIKDNKLNFPPIFVIYDYICVLLNIEKTLDINVNLLRFPMLFKGSEKDVASVNRIFKNIENFKPYSVIDKNLADGIELMKMELNYNPTEIYELEDKYRQLAYGAIGIYGADKKRERLITAEIQSSNDITDAIYQDMLNERQKWVKKANEKYGLNIVLRELYVEGKKDDADLEAYKQGKITKAEEQNTPKEEKVGDDNGE